MSSKPIDSPISMYIDGDTLHFVIPHLTDRPWYDEPANGSTINSVNIILLFCGITFVILICLVGWVPLLISVFFTTIIATLFMKKYEKNCSGVRCEIISVHRSSKKMTLRKEYQIDHKRDKELAYKNPVDKIVFNPPGSRRSNIGHQEQISWGASKLTIYTSKKNQSIPSPYSVSCDQSSLNKHLSSDDLYWMAEELSSFLELKLKIGAETKAPFTPDECEALNDMF
jgi:hypothetical protein